MQRHSVELFTAAGNNFDQHKQHTALCCASSHRDPLRVRERAVQVRAWTVPRGRGSHPSHWWRSKPRARARLIAPACQVKVEANGNEVQNVNRHLFIFYLSIYFEQKDQKDQSSNSPSLSHPLTPPHTQIRDTQPVQRLSSTHIGHFVSFDVVHSAFSVTTNSSLLTLHINTNEKRIMKDEVTLTRFNEVQLLLRFSVCNFFNYRALREEKQTPNLSFFFLFKNVSTKERTQKLLSPCFSSRVSWKAQQCVHVNHPRGHLDSVLFATDGPNCVKLAALACDRKCSELYKLKASLSSRFKALPF